MRANARFAARRSRHFDRGPGLIVLAVVVTVLVVLRAEARACEPIPNFSHMVDPSLLATDHTPPTLPAIPSPTFHYGEESSMGIGCTGAKCTAPTYVAIPALATDDMTDRYGIGYRMTLESGTLPPDLSLPTTAINPTGDVVRVFFNPDTTPSMDFTLQVVAIDHAGNESTPQSVHVELHDSACSVAGGRISGLGLGWIALLALAFTASRRRRGAA